jgi:protein-tyrosine kinase
VVGVAGDAFAGVGDYLQMNTIAQATKRLEELARSGVTTPWTAINPLANSPVVTELDAARKSADEAEQSSISTSPVGGVSSIEEGHGERSGSPTGRKIYSLDFEQLEAAGYLVPATAQSALADEFRHIKRPLLKNVRSTLLDDGNRNSLIMVTSALPAEGKTFCSLNLAMSIAMEVDTSVLLVDADILRPSILGRLGLSAEKGFLDTLVDPTISLSKVILRTNVPKLSILPTGTLNSRSTELLASAAMEQLLIELATRYPNRVMIFDAPPLLLTPSTATLASYMGQVVVVVEASQTSRQTVAQAYSALEHCPIVMSVLNKCTAPMDGRAYGYYYG